MITTHAILVPTIIPKKLFLGSPVDTHYLWDNLIVDKRISINWLHRIYEGSIVDDIWTVLSSPVR